MKFGISIANIDIGIRTIFENTYSLFEDYATDISLKKMNFISIENSLVYSAKPINDSFLEFHNLLFPVSDYLLTFNRVLFHGLAVSINNEIYIITAPSGTGKTTQYKNLRDLFGNAILIINGDKPCLEVKDSRILVHPSPWKGKEGYGSYTSGELKGVIYLSQDKENYINKLKPSKAALPIFTQFLYSAETSTQIESVCKIADVMVKNYPVWHFKNRGDLDSTRMLFKTIMEFGGDKHV